MTSSFLFFRVRGRATTARAGFTYRLLRLLELLAARTDHPGQLLAGGPEHAGELRRGLSDRRGDLRSELLQARQLRQRQDALRVDHLPFDHRRADGEVLAVLHEVREELRRHDDVVVRHDDRGRPHELLGHRLQRRALGGARCKRVLDDAVLHLRVTELPAKPGDRRDVEALGLRDDGRLRLRHLLVELADDLLFFCPVQVESPPFRPPAACAGRRCSGFEPDIPVREPLAKQGTLRCSAVSRLGGSDLTIRLASSSLRPLALGTKRARCLGPETPAAPLPPGNFEFLRYAWCAASSATSTLMPGPMVVLTVTFFTYRPFAVCGFALKMISMMTLKLALSLSGSNDAFPNGTWTIPAFSTRNSTLPAFCSFTARAMSIDTVPTFGFGISPRGPSTLPRRPTTPIMSGVASTLSKSMNPPWIFSARSSAPTMSAPAASASFALSPFAKTAIFTALPIPCGSTTAPRTTWSACFGSTPRLMAASTVSSNFFVAVSFTSFIASSIL